MNADYIPDGDSRLTAIYERDMARRSKEEIDSDEEAADDPCGPDEFEEE